MTVERIKIGFFNCYYPEISGGSEYQTYLLAKSLDKTVYDPFFISLSTHKKGYQELNGDRVYFFKPESRLAKIDKGYIANAAFINRVIKKENPKIIYQRMANSASGILAYLSKIRDFKFIWACASQEDILPLRFRLNSPGSWVENALRIYGIRRADSILLQSSDQLDCLNRRFNLSGTILKNGHPDVDVIAHGYKQPLLVIFIGNFKKIKRPEIFIQLAENFRRRKDVEFVMVGRIPDQNQSASLIRRLSEIGNINWLGELSQAETNSLLGQAYVLVNTSEYEGFSNTFIQAWQRGVPVLSLSVDPDKLLNKEGLGICSGHYNRLCGDLEYLLSNPDVRNEMGRRGVQYALKEHSLSAITSHFKKILAEVLNG
ncbi:hypothetical protein GCM10010960_05290 [Arenimonas maotaiensis]|uniref:Glycosyltransferase n=1 Tax=Arenimonas maotaiensis TaxID=1446479 RepID=A0A917CE97_9GAMM|nr:glycosyltransferase family 4 protein [Arenimonas maotaiensis]GGF86234.1 hypothetical protein GCM10010960_05290 [Arenimonas maotaiensis]